MGLNVVDKTAVVFSSKSDGDGTRALRHVRRPVELRDKAFAAIIAQRD